MVNSGEIVLELGDFIGLKRADKIDALLYEIIITLGLNLL